MTAEWAMVWITAVYVIATCAICWANIRSAKATKEQLAESKRQFDEENRPFVTVTFDVIRSGIIALCIENHGKQVANHVKVQISNEFVDNMTDNGSKELVRKLCEASFTLGIGRKWYVCLGSHLELGQLSKVPLTVDISYSDRNGEYKETTSIDLSQYFWSIMYDSPAEDAKQELAKMSKAMQSIEKKLPKT